MRLDLLAAAAAAAAAACIAALSLLCPSARAQEVPRLVPVSIQAPTPAEGHAGPKSWTRFVSLRPSVGAMISLGSRRRVAAAIDITAGLRLYAAMAPPRIVFLPEIGYSHATTSPSSQHLLTGGMGIGLGALSSSSLGISLVPRLLMTLGEPTRSFGIRNGLLLDLAGLATAEVSHQYIEIEGHDDHSLRLLFGFDLGMALQVLSTDHKRERKSSPR